MAKYVYTVSGIRDGSDEQKIISAVRSCIDVKDIEVSCASSSILLSVEDGRYSDEELKRKLSYALSCAGYTLGAEKANIYIPAKRKKSVRLGTAVLLSLAVGLFCAMLTFGICYRNMKSSISADTPEYIHELIRLDEFFRTYSYDGITDKNFKEHLLDAYIAYSGDLYAEYYTDAELEALDRDMAGEFVGIGITIKQDSVTVDGVPHTVIRVKEVYKDSPAQQENIISGDMIYGIYVGDDLKTVDELGYEVALNHLAGKEGSVAKFNIYREQSDGEYESIEFSVTRKKIITASVKGNICTTDPEVGIIHITKFNYTTPEQFCTETDKLIEAGCKYFVIDLRDNPGGYGEAIVSVLSYFLDSGDLVMTIEDNKGVVSQKYTVQARENEYFKVTKDDIGKYKGLNIAVLTNENTASAAELFTATVRDYSLGTIIGTKTYGKGCMQHTYNLKQYGIEGALKLTTHLYFSKSHTSYHGTGIVPDVEIELSDEARSLGIGNIPHDVDNQLQSAIENLKNKK